MEEHPRGESAWPPVVSDHIQKLQRLRSMLAPPVTRVDSTNDTAVADQGLKQRRIAALNTAKGIGSVAVVISHIHDGDSWPTRMIFLFAMPLYFFIAGDLFRLRPQQRAYARDKALHLLLPYGSYLMLLYLIPRVWEIASGAESPGHLLKRLGVVVIGGRLLTAVCTTFWFPTALFLTQQLVNALLLRFDRFTVGLLMVLSLVLAYVNAAWLRPMVLPWDANVVLCAAPLLFLGHCLHGRDITPRCLGLCLLLVVLAGVAQFRGLNVSLDMKYSNYGIPLISLAASVAGILLLLDICMRLSAFSSAPLRVLRKLGEASMVTMFLHQSIQFALKGSGYESEVLRVVLALVGSLAAYTVFKNRVVTRVLLLGSSRDFDTLHSTLSLRWRLVRERFAH